MKKKFLLILILATLAGCAMAAKYTINTSGTVKTQGKVVAPSVIKNPYSVYTAGQYINSNTPKTSSIGVVDIVMDYSGSMANCIEEAKRAMSTIVSQIPSSTNLGFRVFGHDYNGMNPNNNATLAKVKEVVKSKNGKYKVKTSESPIGKKSGYCSATQAVAPIAQANSNTLLKGMNSVYVGGATPLVYALDRAVEEDFRAFQGQQKKIILITDGGENCGGDACAYAKELAKYHPEVHIDVVLVQGRFSGLNCVASQTGGRVYNLDNLSDFSNVIQESINAPVQTTNPIQQYEFYNDDDENAE